MPVQNSFGPLSEPEGEDPPSASPSPEPHSQLSQKPRLSRQQRPRTPPAERAPVPPDKASGVIRLSASAWGQTEDGVEEEETVDLVATIWVRINGHQSKGLADTGAGPNCISKAHFKQIGAGSDLRPTDKIMEAANGSRLSVQGFFFADVQFCALNVPEVYSGPRYVRSVKSSPIAPRTRQWVAVSVFPHRLSEDTVFLGNPALQRNHLVVSDFILGPEDGASYIQVSNTSSEWQEVLPSQNLAVDDENSGLFTTVNSVRSGAGVNDVSFEVNSQLTPEQRQQALALLESYRDVFVSDVSQLRRCDYPPVRIDYDQTRTVRLRNYRMSPDEKQFVEEYIGKLLQADLVEECTSVYSTPILVVPKPNHTPEKPAYRLVQDFRKINKILVDVKYPIPDTQELIDSFQGKTWFSIVDSCSGYSQLTLHPDSRDITAFDSPSGCRYRWKALAQGLSVAPALYALAMDQILFPLKRSGHVLNYFDDISVGTESFEGHLRRLSEFFSLLRERGVKLNIKKSTFFQRRVQFLGMVLDGKEVTIPESRAVYGFSPKSPGLVQMLPTPDMTLNRKMTDQEALQAAIRAHLRRAPAAYKASHDAHRKEVAYRVGDR
ncbi:hypothetical protein FOCC_FOCC000805, partial [Frankliniella occidentalis]